MATLLQIIKQIQEQHDAIHGFEASYEAIRRHVREVTLPLQKAQKELAAQMKAAQEVMRPLQDSLEVIRRQQEAWAKSVQGIMVEVPKRMRKVQEYLFDRGWYLGPDAALPCIAKLAQMVDKGRHDQIEEAMQSWAESRSDAVSKEIKATFASRREIIEDALAAHRDGKYTLSVPVLLAQADGLANEIIGSFLFHGKPKQAFEKLLASLSSFTPTSTLDALTTPLRSYSALGKAPQHLIPGSKQGHANRHKVMHGESTDYAAKANSLRAISLIDYLLGIKDMLNSHKEWAKEWRRGLEDGLAGPGTASVS